MSSINSVSSTSTLQSMHGMRRPDPAKMAENLFDQLDTSSQGYLQKTDFQSAFSAISSSSTNNASSTDVDSLFTQLDGDSDGKVTKQEFSSALTRLADQLDQQFQSSRMQGAMQMGGMGGMGGMPPPPPPNDSGFTKDELSNRLDEIGSTDSQRSSLISNIVDNFDEADSDGDGKVSFKEAMAFDQLQPTNAASNRGVNGAGDADASAATAVDSEAKVMLQIMQLVRAYMSGDQAVPPRVSVTA